LQSFLERTQSSRRLILTKRHQEFKQDGLSRFLVYVLGHRPDEFGLLPNLEGFINFKELLQALHEETGWSYVRQSHLNELLMGKGRALFETSDKGIRSRVRHWEVKLAEPLQSLPKVLYTPVRRRAHPVVMEKGLEFKDGRYVTLSSIRDMALRIGRRRDQQPVILEVVAMAARDEGISFNSLGDLFFSPQIPAKFISGPPVHEKAFQEHRATPVKKEGPLPSQFDFAPGSFLLDAHRDPDPFRRAKGRKRFGWKEEAKKTRRTKRR
jgi:putative RNA 2'-phosphotransferase